MIAAGAWSSEIEVLGVPPIPAAKPIKGHLVGYHQPEQTCSTILRHGHLYILQRANGLLIIGASVEDVGWDRAVRSEVVDELCARRSIRFSSSCRNDTERGLDWLSTRRHASSRFVAFAASLPRLRPLSERHTARPLDGE